MRRAKLFLLVGLAFLLLCINVILSKNAEGFVKEVSCSSESITVVINQSDPEVARWMSNPKTQPVIYVYGHKTRHPCGTSMKNEKGLTNFNLTIPYGKECDVTLVDLQPNHRTAETTVVLEDNADQTFSKTLRINHVFCLYARSVQTIRFNDISNAHEIVASTGSKPKPKVDMFFKSADGKSLKYAKLEDSVEFFVALSADKAYHGMSPKECMFSDREDINSPGASKMSFVQSGCPVDITNDLMEPLANVNDQVYFTKFKTFRFGNQSTVFVHCILQVCLKREECSRSCYKKVTNSNLTAERLLFRHRRNSSPLSSKTSADMSEVAITHELTVLSSSESELLAQAPRVSVIPASIQTVSPQKECISSSSLDVGFCAFVVIIALLAMFLVSTTFAINLAYKLKKKSEQSSFDIMSAYSNAALNYPMTYAQERTSAYVDTHTLDPYQ